MRNSNKIKGLIWVLIGCFLIAPLAQAQQEPEARATFLTLKLYEDFNPAPVDVTITCNTGLPLQQDHNLDPFEGDLNDSVEFVVKDFNSGELDCEIVEEVPVGYGVVYIWFDEDEAFVGEDGCFFENEEHGDVASLGIGQEQANNICLIVNLLLPSEVVVTKEWIDENPQFQANNFARANYLCTNVPNVGEPRSLDALGSIGATVRSQLSGAAEGLIFNPEFGTLTFIGNPAEDAFQTFANWDGGTECSVTERTVDSGVETDSSDCQDIVLFPGDDAACTIVNTRLYEGIPTLSNHGLALLVLMMLGLGLVAYRRFV